MTRPEHIVGTLVVLGLLVAAGAVGIKSKLCLGACVPVERCIGYVPERVK